MVVGIDGSEGSVAALRWALAEARLRGSSVRVVHVYQSPRLPLIEGGLGAAGGFAATEVFTQDFEQLRGAAESEARNLIDEALEGAGGAALAGLEIDRDAIEGPAAQTLLESARGAELLVVGSRGRGGFLGLVLGSVSQQCAQHPPCPVVILPPQEQVESGGAEA